MLRNLSDIDPIDSDASFGNIVQTHDKIDESRLSNAGFSDQAVHLAGLNF